MSNRLENKVALVTGGTTGIGLATAKLFRDEGARVIVTGQNPRTLEAARAALGSTVDVVRSDAGDSAAISALFDHVKRAHDGLDVLFLNAGIVRTAPMEALAEADFDEVFRVNVKGPWLAIRAAIPLLRRGGSVVLNGSIVGRIGGAGSTVYGASKAAVRSLGRTTASELVARGVRVNVLSPGPTDTGVIEKSGWSSEIIDTVKRTLIGKIPQGRLGTSEEIARVALFLASDDSSFMTGAEVMVDGGFTSL